MILEVLNKFKRVIVEWAIFQLYYGENKLHFDVMMSALY
jgi:hypothetical protein